MTRNADVYSARRCAICGGGTVDGTPFCCRKCALEQQRRTFGHTLAELRARPELRVERNAGTPERLRLLASFISLSRKERP